MSTATLESPTVKPPMAVRRFTVDDYHIMIEGGVFDDDNRYELLEGMVVPKMPPGPPHYTCARLTERAIRQKLPPGWDVRNQGPITTADSEPEPDLAIVRGDIEDYEENHPGPADIALIVEVAKTSHHRDLKLKPRIYARAGIVEYWVVDVRKRTIEVMTQPKQNGAEPRYAKKKTYTVANGIPLTIAGKHMANLPVAKLFPAKK